MLNNESMKEILAGICISCITSFGKAKHVSFSNN